MVIIEIVITVTTTYCYDNIPKLFYSCQHSTVNGYNKSNHIAAVTMEIGRNDIIQLRKSDYATTAALASVVVLVLTASGAL